MQPNDLSAWSVPPSGPYPPQAYPGQGGPAPQGGYPPPAQGGYPPPAQGGYPPPAQGGYPPAAQGGYPAQGINPLPPYSGYPQPAQGAYPAPAQGGYPAPVQSGYPAQGVNPAPPHGGYPQPSPSPHPAPAHGNYPTPSQGAHPTPAKSTAVGLDVMDPTVRPVAGFDASSDSEKLRKAMKGLGTDEKAIIDVLTNRSEEQRLQIVKQFKTMYGKDLIEEFKSEMSGKLLKVVKALCYPSGDYAAMELRDAMKGAGTDEEALIELLCTKSNDQLKTMIDAYKRIYPGRNLEKDIQSETHGHFKRLLISQLQANRDESQQVNQQAAMEDAERLYKAGEKKLGTDESTFNMIMCSRSYAHLRAVFAAYETVSKNNIEKAIKKEMSGDLRDSQLAIVDCVLNKPKFFAKRLYKSMKGAGTDDDTLIRIVVSRCEIDMGHIKQEFEKEYKKSLAAAVKGDTSGDYEKILLGLIK